MKTRERAKLQKILGGIADQSRLPAAIFVVDVKREIIAVKEAQRLNIPVFGIVDTNSDPDLVDFPIPANDDAFKSIALIMSAIGQAIEEGLSERKRDRDDSKSREDEGKKRSADEDEDADIDDVDDDQPKASRKPAGKYAVEETEE